LGATYLNDQVHFRVWAPEANKLRIVFGAGSKDERSCAMTKALEGYFTAILPGALPGELYSFYVDDRGPLPDPASRYQPQGVHGPSAIVDATSYQWHDEDWIGVALQDIVFYELHVGAFTPEGTFRSAAGKLGYLKDLGVTAVEVMPLADFAGNRNWGYDGVAPFAPARCYGTPDDFRYFVDQAHQIGLAVFVDAVYNHFGPDGAYQGCFSRHYFTNRHHTPWGNAINFDGPLSSHVREYFIENALRWIHEYHVDGLRLDATHAIKDDSPRHILTELAAAVSHWSAEMGRRVHVIAEDARNLAQLVRPEGGGGMGLAGVWADDFHHHMRRALAGDRDGYFAEFDGSTQSIADTARLGWLRGSDSADVEYSRFVYCIQNHDQTGNRALGDRLHQKLNPASYRAASALLVLLPHTPLLFMGQEWAASTPFLYFTNHDAELGALVTEGRLREFEAFTSFSNAAIPDPQAADTFFASRLNWDELIAEPHASVLRLYRSLLHLRHTEPSLGAIDSVPRLRIEALDDSTLLLHRVSADETHGLLAVIRLHGSGQVNLSAQAFNPNPLWNSEDPQFAVDSEPITVDPARSLVGFSRPGAIVFRTVFRTLEGGRV
jgi:maltooligosyltrehalose trehalohydrolase